MWRVQQKTKYQKWIVVKVFRWSESVTVCIYQTHYKVTTPQLSKTVNKKIVS